jgi:hypothetical protein
MEERKENNPKVMLAVTFPDKTTIGIPTVMSKSELKDEVMLAYKQRRAICVEQEDDFVIVPRHSLLMCRVTDVPVEHSGAIKVVRPEIDPKELFDATGKIKQTVQ